MKVTIERADLPLTVKGAATDDFIVINRNISRTEQLVALWHEITHLWRGDTAGDDVAKSEADCRQDMIKAAMAILEE